MAKQLQIKNPFRPGAGHMPPYLAGRDEEKVEFGRLLAQDTVLENPLLTGLRGLGKTVLLETFKPMAIQAGWLWTGTDLSESMSISDENLAVRLMTDLALVTSQVVIGEAERRKAGFARIPDVAPIALNYANLRYIYDNTPGLVIDKLKTVLETVAPYLSGKRGLILAYDEAQNLADHADDKQFPLSLLLDLFQSIQRKDIPFMLVLTGLPTLFPKLVEARTFAERMFHVIQLRPLTQEETKLAISKPIDDNKCPVAFTPDSINTIWEITRGYPYFVQFACREVFDVWVQRLNDGIVPDAIPVDAILRKLDADFFAGRWARATDRQRDLLAIVAHLPAADDGEFGVRDIVESKGNSELDKPFSSSHISQMLATLVEVGLVYKNRHGKYCLAVPLLANFIRRTVENNFDGAG